MECVFNLLQQNKAAVCRDPVGGAGGEGGGEDEHAVLLHGTAVAEICDHDGVDEVEEGGGGGGGRWGESGFVGEGEVRRERRRDETCDRCLEGG